jgi:hypothetical protein
MAVQVVRAVAEQPQTVLAELPHLRVREMLVVMVQMPQVAVAVVQVELAEVVPLLAQVALLVQDYQVQ